MDETYKKLPSNTLRAEELLRSKGIRTNALEEWEKSLQVLPKSGKKHFEPNNSWLEKVQIEKGLKTRRNLLNIERVERVSDLASAEWIPAQKKALVTKKSGQDWSSFGTDKNGSLYLIPEEALFLLETNCLELIWNGVPCSVQQAYEILIDDISCTLDEYRVYSQLTRCGYRIQRYVYEESDKCGRSDELSVKRKVIVDPENGLRMYDSQTQNQQISEKPKETLVKDVLQPPDTSLINSNTKDCQDIVTEKPVEQIIFDVIDHILCNIEDQKSVNNSTGSQIIESNKKPKNDMNGEEKSRNSKLEIISDETLVGSIKILSDTSCSSKKEVTASKWPGTRIQRNVKLMPKRNDKISNADVSIIDSNCTGENPRNYGKWRMATTTNESPDAKKAKHEVIELSDDEIQELPRTITRMEMLNLLPNIASKSDITEKISKRYIPLNIRPQKNAYQYNQAKISHMQENDRRARQNCKDVRNNSRQSRSCYSNYSSSRSSGATASSSRNAAYQNPHARSSLCGLPRTFYPMDHYMPVPKIGFACTYHRVPFSYGPSAYTLQNRMTLMQHNVFQNMLVAFENHGNAVQQTRSLTIQMNNFAMPYGMGPFRMRHPFMENQCRQSFYQNFSWQQRFWQRRPENVSTVQGNVYPVANHRYEDARRSGTFEIVNRPSFTTRPGVSSWAELKKKWCEEKTITIDDEDNKNVNESGEEVQVVEQFINPLVGPKCATSLAEVYSKLAIIKSAPEKTVRRKKSRYKISYNVYSCSHPYKKSKPGQPLYSLVVIRKENSFLQPIELNRLQQDAKGSPIILACVSMSISYIQPGIITMPNVI